MEREGLARLRGPLYDAMTFLLHPNSQQDPGEGTSAAASAAQPQAEKVRCVNCRNKEENDDNDTDNFFGHYLAAHLKNIPFCLKVDLKIQILSLLKRAHHINSKCGCQTKHKGVHMEYQNTPGTFSIASTVSDDEDCNNSDSDTSKGPEYRERVMMNGQGSSGSSEDHARSDRAQAHIGEPNRTHGIPARIRSRRKQARVNPQVVRLPDNLEPIPSIDLESVSGEVSEYQLIPVMVTPIAGTTEFEDGVATQAYEIEHLPGWGFSNGNVSPSSLSTLSNNSAEQGSPPTLIVSPTASGPSVSGEQHPSTSNTFFPGCNDTIQPQAEKQPETQKPESEQQEIQNQENGKHHNGQLESDNE
ncbi:hypothetical protein LSTR_LSTR015025 [Laodelphax striatellus]|uniref:BESS domain-containing protein n=1 Tax=Laodelphax striatellus TaxID=195883 RepID=A0A482XK67_LAOST|nr:hypothetical protein LSTR_LSTR015025 [Laodelphax striatellus]